MRLPKTKSNRYAQLTAANKRRSVAPKPFDVQIERLLERAEANLTTKDFRELIVNLLETLQEISDGISAEEQ